MTSKSIRTKRKLRKKFTAFQQYSEINDEEKVLCFIMFDFCKVFKLLHEIVLNNQFKLTSLWALVNKLRTD